MQDFQEDEKKNHDRIMLVEDDTTITRVLKRQLERWGYEVFDTVDFDRVMENFAKWKPDLVLMDIQMPRMDGYTATREIRTLPNNRKANVPIVAMTANAFEEDRKKAFECGMNGHIVKPIDRRSISKVLDQIFKEAK